MMTKSHSDKLHFAETFSKPPGSDHSLWPIGTRELASLVDLGLSDDRIARYFGVEQAKVSALRLLRTGRPSKPIGLFGKLMHPRARRRVRLIPKSGMIRRLKVLTNPL